MCPRSFEPQTATQINSPELKTGSLFSSALQLITRADQIIIKNLVDQAVARASWLPVGPLPGGFPDPDVAGFRA